MYPVTSAIFMVTLVSSMCLGISAVRPNTCPWGFIRCDNQNCVDELLKCNGHNDCGDYSDEKNCTCAPGTFKCRNGRCILMSWVCDYDDDCDDNSDETNCSGADPCNKNGGCDHNCLVIRTANGSATGRTCQCRLGYYLRKDGTTCVDVDECTSPNVCDRKCINTDGSYLCNCPAGYKMGSDKKTCIDVNECVNGNNGGCEHLCDNTIGSYTCRCKDGYLRSYRNQKHCVDIDECGMGVPKCHVCHNIPGGFSCDCDHGFNQNANKTGCTDINECATRNGGCEHVCTNVPGRFECHCKPGFKATYAGSNSCVDIDECKGDGNVLPCQDKCVNELGSFKCYCKPGFQLGTDSRSCLDIDECKNPALHQCGHRCINKLGSYECKCNPNFFLASDGKTCRDTFDFSECGNSSSKMKVTQDWEETEQNLWPWTVYFITSYASWFFQSVDGCIGTILSDKWVITASHCLSTDRIFVKTNNGKEIKIKKTYRSKRAEVTLVELTQPITFVKTVRPICLPKASNLKATLKDFANTVGMVLATEGSDYVYKKSVRIGGAGQCMGNAQHRFIPKTMVCAGNNEDSCPGDSGSPLMYSVKTPDKDIVYLGGVLIWGRDILNENCDQSVRYLAYTNLEKIIPWIKRLTGLK